jgi:hypothetical protein
MFEPPGVRPSFGSEPIEPLHGGLIDAIVDVSVDVEDSSCALVSKPVGDVSWGLVLSDEHRYARVAEITPSSPPA